MCGLLAVADYYFFKEIGRSDKRVTGEYLVCIDPNAKIYIVKQILSQFSVFRIEVSL